MTNSIRKQLRRIAELEISNFETQARVEKRQKHLLSVMQDDRIIRRPKGLADCTLEHCGRINCLEACHFSAWCRRIHNVPAAYDLITDQPGAIWEIEVGRAAWVRPVGDLAGISILAMKQLNRRALDSLHNPDIVAVGAVKLTIRADQWVPSIHQVIAGATKRELAEAFSQNSDEATNIMWSAKAVENVGQAVSDVLRYNLPRPPPQADPPTRAHGWRTEDTFRPSRLTRGKWVKYYNWLIRLPFNMRLIRYGCDRYFNQLIKAPRLLHAKPRKNHPYPTWLVPHMFGDDKWKDRDPHDF